MQGSQKHYLLSRKCQREAVSSKVKENVTTSKKGFFHYDHRPAPPGRPPSHGFIHPFASVQFGSIMQYNKKCAGRVVRLTNPFKFPYCTNLTRKKRKKKRATKKGIHPSIPPPRGPRSLRIPDSRLRKKDAHKTTERRHVHQNHDEKRSI
jgi:hypothetical protein